MALAAFQVGNLNRHALFYTHSYLPYSAYSIDCLNEKGIILLNYPRGYMQLEKPQSHANPLATIPLNPEQEKAVTHQAGPILVVAGAGSGKTRVITARIVNLIVNLGQPTNSILALTFTNKAAHEMKERIAKLLGGEYPLPFVGTFHSYCLQLLKKNSYLVDMPYFSILDEDDQKKIINGILKRTNLDKQFSARQVCYQISLAKNQLATANVSLFGNPALYDIYTAYEQEKSASKCLDFDDLLIKTLELFDKHKEFKADFQRRVKHVLVDEYQDTNKVQHELLKQICLNDKELAVTSVCAVGDEDQSIYSWRGASISNMLDFAKDFPGTAHIKIEQNYRSVQPILDLANHVIAENVRRNPKTLWSTKKARNRARLMVCLSEYQEASTIASGMRTMKRQSKKHSAAVLYRTHAQSRAIEEALIKQSVPYKIIGGVQFYERKEIKDVLAYLRLAANPFDRPSFFRVINCPTRGLGAKFEELFHAHWQKQPLLDYAQIAKDPILLDALPASKQKALTAFCATIEKILAANTPLQATELLLEEIGYFTFLKNSYEADEAQMRIENIKELMNAMRHFYGQGITTLQDFITEVSLLQERITSSEIEDENVLLMTLRAAKGLEFDTVILAGLEETILPSSRSLKDEDAIEEERRLFYVGITRAKERLLLIHVKHRYMYGQMSYQVTSRFVRDIPYYLAPSEDATNWTIHQIYNFFTNWIGPNAFIPTLGIKKPSTLKPKKPAKPKPQIVSPFKKGQPVQHKKYGIGIIESVEHKQDKTIHVSVQFKVGLKKIAANFLEIV